VIEELGRVRLEQRSACYRTSARGRPPFTKCSIALVMSRALIGWRRSCWARPHTL